MPAASCLAQEHQHGNGEKLGDVRFATSCNEAAQKDFKRAAVWENMFAGAEMLTRNPRIRGVSNCDLREVYRRDGDALAALLAALARSPRTSLCGLAALSLTRRCETGKA